jgi:hypothetical protein
VLPCGFDFCDLVFCFAVVPLDGGLFCGGEGLVLSMALAKSGAPTAALKRQAAASKGILRMDSSGLEGATP